MHSVRKRVSWFAVAIVLLGASPAPIVQPPIGVSAWTADGVAKLDGDIDAMLASDPALHGAHYGVYAIDEATGEQLYAHRADDEFQPASTLKLLVGSAALEKLGPAKTFRTQLLRTAIGPGTPFDAIVLRAGGDPFLDDRALGEAADATAAASIHALRGVFIDDSRFETAPYPAGWTWDDFAQSYAPHVSAIAFDENVVDVTVAPATEVGKPAVVRAASATTTGVPIEACIADIMDYVSVLPHATTGPPQSDDTIDVKISPGGCLEIVGSIPLGAAPEHIGAAVHDPPSFARVALIHALTQRGVTSSPLSGGALHHYLRASSFQLAATDTIWSHDSAPLSTWLGPRFWIPSDNLVGEMLLRELGYVTAGSPGTTDNGIVYEKSWLQSIGVDPQTVTLADGCGMSQYDRITPRDLVTILQHDWFGPNRQLVLDSLPVGGARGTIEGIAGTDAAGRVFAKTGSMMHVRGLAGYLATVRHGPVTFAFQVDDWNGDYPALARLRARVLSRIIDD